MESSVSAPPSLAIISRSGTVSMAMTRPAPSRNALRIANCPTGPQPHTATVSPGWMLQFSAAMYPVGKMCERNRTFSSGIHFGILIGPNSAEEMRVAEQARRTGAVHLLGQRGVRVAVVAQRPHAFLAEEAAAAANRE